MIEKLPSEFLMGAFFVFWNNLHECYYDATLKIKKRENKFKKVRIYEKKGDKIRIR